MADERLEGILKDVSKVGTKTSEITAVITPISRVFSPQLPIYKAIYRGPPFHNQKDEGFFLTSDCCYQNVHLFSKGTPIRVVTVQNQIM